MDCACYTCTHWVEYTPVVEAFFLWLHMLMYVHGEMLGRWDISYGYTTGVPCMADLYWASVLSTVEHVIV